MLETKNIRYAHSDGHTDVCYGCDNRSILTCGSDGNVRIWVGSEDDDPSVYSVSERTLAIACTKDQFFVATDSNYVQAFTYPENKRDKIIFRFSAPVTHISVSLSKKYIAAGSCDMEIQVLNTETNKISILTGHTAPVLGVSVDPLDQYIASSSCDGSLKIWDIVTGSVVQTFSNILPVKNDFFKAICLGRAAWKSVTGTVFAVPKDMEVIVYRRETWEELYRLKSDNIEKPLSVVLFSPCGNYIAAASVGGEIIIWEIKYKSEVCLYKDLKKAGISGMAWHPDGSEISFSDRLGRLSVLTGINEEISRHVVPEKNKKQEVNVSIADEIDTNALFDDDDDDDDDDDEDDENCISLDKIKAPYKNESEDEVPPGSPDSTNTEKIREPAIPLTEPQSAFQPSSTPSHFEPRCLCYNAVGIVRYYDSDKTVDVQFHDNMFHHALFLRSFGVCTMAALSMNVLCLAVASRNENHSKLSCIPLSSWAGSKEWTVFMPENEDIVSVAAGGNWVAVATNVNHLRIFTYAGTQKQIVSLPGPVVCMSGHEEKVLIICHSSIGMNGNQNEGFIMYRISNLHVTALIPFQPLPLFPKSVLNWAGFTDEGTPCTFDSEGLLRLLGHDLLHWEIVHDFRNLRKSPSDHYFIIGLSEKYQNARCVLCRNSLYPLIINTPTVLEIPLKLPLCAPDTEKSIQEEAFWRLMFSLHTLGKSEKGEFQEEVTSSEQTLKQTALKLFAEACRNSEDLRAFDVATFMSSHPLEVAVKYASKVGKMYLAEKLNGVVPVDWKNQYSNTDVIVTKTCFSENLKSTDKSVYSQQDLFEDYPEPTEKENRPVKSTVEVDTEQFETLETLKMAATNPFKKVQPQKNEGPKGLKFLDSLMTKVTPKASKPQFPNKQLNLKPLNTSKDKTDSAVKKPTFVQWFSTRKALLSEKYPSVSAGELTKLGMKAYKEEMSQPCSEERVNEQSELYTSEVKKRVSEDSNESVPKRCKSVEENS